MALAIGRACVAPAIAKILADVGFHRNSALKRETLPLISLDSLPNRATLLVRKLQAAGLQVYVHNLTSTGGVATISCTIAEPSSVNAHSGCGTHPDARVALSRALTEAAQTRITSIQGGREDLAEFPATEGFASETYCRSNNMLEFEEIASYEHQSINEDVELLIEGLRQSGFDQVIAIDLTKPQVGIPVVRVIVPRAEAWTLFCLHTGRGVLGNRMLRQFETVGE
jgi:ribosomal protein S12 methylthiotransferase accessory factor